MAQAGMGTRLVSTTKKIAESVAKSIVKATKATVTNFNLSNYTVDTDLNLPVGSIKPQGRPILTPYAGPGYGFICTARENQSVVLLPIDGDRNNSIAIGRVFEIDKEAPPLGMNIGDVLLKHELGSQFSFSYSQPVTGENNLDLANAIKLTLAVDPVKVYKNGEITASVSETNDAQLVFEVMSLTSTLLLAGYPIRIVLNYKATDISLNYLNTYVEWETKTLQSSDDKLYVIISDANTIVGGPLYQPSNNQTYMTAQYNDKYFGMIISPDKGNSQFSHYMGMGLYMEEYPSRVEIGSVGHDDGRSIRSESGVKSWSLNDDAFLDNTLDEEGKLQNFPRGSLSLKHYTKSGIYIQEKVNKTYDLDREDLKLTNQKTKWNQSSISFAGLLFRKTPQVNSIGGLNDPEKPLASLLMEDDCKNSIYNSVHIRLAQDNTAVQRITKPEIENLKVIHYDDPFPQAKIDPIYGTRPSRLQFYDIKTIPENVDSLQSDDNYKKEWMCLHYLDSLTPSSKTPENKCRLNYNRIKDDSKELQYVELPREDWQTHPVLEADTKYVDKKLGKKTCPFWPGCVEGHYTNRYADIPIAQRNSDIRVNNVDLLVKPKANVEMVHYTGSGLFIEEQLATVKKSSIAVNTAPDHAKLKKWLDITASDIAVSEKPGLLEGVFDPWANSQFHAPILTLRLREWDYTPFSDGTTKVMYDDGIKNNAFEPKRYDACKLELETIYGVRPQSFEEGDNVAFTDHTADYGTATNPGTANRVTLAQTIYGNKIDPEDSNIQLGNRLIFQDSLESDTDGFQTVPVGIWELSDKSKDAKLGKDMVGGATGDDKDSRLIFPKGKIELLHYTNSGLIIEEENLDATKHSVGMSLVYNQWDLNNFRPTLQKIPVSTNAAITATDLFDPVSMIRWEETAVGGADPTDPTTSMADFFIYLNSARDQVVTKWDDSAKAWTKKWWDGATEGGAPENPTGAYIGIRESDNAVTAPTAPIVELSDSLNNIKMNSLPDGSKIEITNRTTQFTDQEAGVNKIVMDAVAKTLSLINGYEGGAVDGNHSLVMDKENKKITITDINGNNILIDSDSKKIVITDKDNKNTITLSSDGIKIEDGTNKNVITLSSSSIKIDSNATTIEVKNGGDIGMKAGGSTLDIKKDGDVKIKSAGKISIEGSGGVTIKDSQVEITGGMLKTKGTAAPDPSGGPYNAIPMCIFSGIAHCGNTVSGT